MTRRHIEAIAGALRAARPKYEDIGYYEEGTTAWEDSCNAVANAIRGINPSFDVKRFLTDCGVNV